MQLQNAVIKKGSISMILTVYLEDDTYTPAIGMVFNTANFAASYRRPDGGNANAVDITLSAGTRGTYSSGGFVACGTKSPGLYELGIPDAALASGADEVVISLYNSAFDIIYAVVRIQLTAVNLQDSVRGGLTSLPNVAFGSIGGLGPTVIDSGTAQSALSGSIVIQTGASSVNNTYRGCVIVTTGGTGAGQVRGITVYNGSTKTCTIDRNWTTTPDATTNYVILPYQSAALNDSLQVVTTVSPAVNDIVTGVFSQIIDNGFSFLQTMRVVGAFVGGARTKPTANSVNFYSLGADSSGVARLGLTNLGTDGTTTTQPNVNA